MQIFLDQQTGWLDGVRQLYSPHQDERPADVIIDLLVIHGISLPPGEFSGNAIDQLFTNTLNSNAHPYFLGLTDLRVSAHLLIRRDGALTQYVSFLKRAWHAGVSNFQGREKCNDFSIGIELEGTDEIAYTLAQYQRLAEVTRLIKLNFPAITDQRIVGHSDIAPGRKTDPGLAFDWQLFQDLLADS